MPNFHDNFEAGKTNLDIPIFQKTYDLYKNFYQYLNNFPKRDRYTIGQRCENTMLDLLEAIASASQLPKNEKLPTLQKCSVKLDLLKVLVRLCKDLKILDNKKYLIIESNLLEIGKMLGGWIKSTTFVDR